jgi:hypothetical protein
MAGISLNIETLDPESYVAGVYPLRITATSTEPDLDSEIFVFHARDVNDPLPGDQFECVASYQQMQELPVDAPISGPTPVPYYRKSVVEFYVTDPAEISDIRNIVIQDTTFLIRSARLLGQVSVVETVDINPA